MEKAKVYKATNKDFITERVGFRRGSIVSKTVRRITSLWDAFNLATVAHRSETAY